MIALCVAAIAVAIVVLQLVGVDVRGWFSDLARV
jgi:hypothetical protein